MRLTGGHVRARAGGVSWGWDARPGARGAADRRWTGHDQRESSPAARSCHPFPSAPVTPPRVSERSEEHTSELQSRQYLVCRLLLEKKKKADKLHLPHV